MLADEDTHGAEFDNWLHDRGYTYIGDASMYKLTLPEMARLYRGWRATKEKEALAQQGAYGQAGQAGVGSGDIGKAGVQAKARTSNPHRQRLPGQPRESDLRTLEQFQNRIGGNGDNA